MRTWGNGMLFRIESYLTDKEGRPDKTGRAHDRERKFSIALEKAQPGDVIELQSAIYDLSWIFIPLSLPDDLEIYGELGTVRARLEGAERFLNVTKAAKTKLRWMDITVLNWSGRSQAHGLRMAARQDARRVQPSTYHSKGIVR